MAFSGVPGRAVPGLLVPGSPLLTTPAPPSNIAAAIVTIAPAGSLGATAGGAVSVTNAVIPWVLTLPAGSLEEFTFTFTQLSGGFYIPFPIAGATWEYVVRLTPTTGGSPLITVSTTASASGQISVTATSALSQVLLTLFPAATATLAPQQYFHAFWENPGTSAAFCWASGPLIIQGTTQP